MTNIFVVNGFPRSGKDTFATILGDYKKVYKCSSVDLIKKIAKEAGWDGNKDDKGRKLLADLKKALVEYDDLPIKYIQNEVTCFISGDYDIMLIDIREPEEIKKAKKLFGARTIFIENLNVENVITNTADASINIDGYDYVINNNGTLEEFRQNIEEFIDKLEEFNNG